MEANGDSSPVVWQSDEPGHISRRGRANARDDVHNPLWEILADEWDPETNQNGYVNLSVAENSLIHSEIEEHIRTKVTSTSRTLRYGKDGFLGSKQLRASMAAFLSRWMKPVYPITAEQIAITSGVTNALETCAWTLLDSGDAILVGRPYYMGFSVAFSSRADVKVLPVSFGDIDPFSLKAVQQYEKTIRKAKGQSIRVKGLLLCSPHNPLGRCYPKETLIAFMCLCQQYGLHLISDEIYALSVWENEEAPNATEYTSILAIDKTNLIDNERVHALWGVSKDFGLNGLRVGCIISQDNTSFLAALKNVSLFMGPSSMADDAVTGILSDTEFADQCVRTLRRRLAASYDLAVNYLQVHGIRCRRDNNAGLFIWARLENGKGESESDEESVCKAPSSLMQKLLMKGVMLNDGEEFFAEEEGWFRIVFSHTDLYLMEGLDRVVRAVLE